jgi:hypothetical protein
MFPWRLLAWAADCCLEIAEAEMEMCGKHHCTLGVVWWKV